MKEKYLVFFLSLACSLSSAFGQLSNPEQVVQKNLDYYNKRDIEGFMRSFSDSITFYNFSDQRITAKGLAEVRKLYTDLFEASPNLHSTILKRIVFNHTVIDHESIIGRKGSADVLELVLIYEVKEEKIYKVTVMRK